MAKQPKNRDEFDRFFATFGLDSSTWAALTNNSNSFTSTPTRFFTSNDSMDSGARRLSMMSRSSEGSRSADGSPLSKSVVTPAIIANEPSLNGGNQASKTGQSLSPEKRQLTLSASLSSYGLSKETSIVEKNYRVIKWLYNCKKATAEGDVDDLQT
jgi:sulfur carrier protein ThiS